MTSLCSLGVAAPKGLTDSDWTSIRAAYEVSKHQFNQEPDGSHSARNSGLGWTMKFDDRGFTATNGTWTWGLELEDGASAEVQEAQLKSPQLCFPRTANITEWFINDQRGLEQGWTLSAPAAIKLRVRGDLRPRVSAQSITFGNQITYSGLKAWDANGRTVPTHFEATDSGFAVCYDDSGAEYPITIDPIAQNAYLKASNAEAGDWFGESVAISGDTVVVGADGEDSNATGVNGNETNNSEVGSGAAYVFVRSGGAWTQQAYLKASNTGTLDQFGTSVAISGDTLVVGASGERSNATGVNGNQANNSQFGSGAAYVFVRSGNTWSQQAYLKASNTGAGDTFGGSVAISGNTIVVGSRAEASSAIGVNGNQADNSAAQSGAAYVFVRSGSTWTQQAYLKASNSEAGDEFGKSVTIDGDTVIIGADEEDSRAAGVNDNQADNGADDAGAAYVFFRVGSTWTQQAYLKASNPSEGSHFGTSVAISGDTAVIGAWGEGSPSKGVNGTQASSGDSFSGAAYVFIRVGDAWLQQAFLKASNPADNDFFGWAVAISGDTVVVGAEREGSGATGYYGNQADNSASFAGAVYVFGRSGRSWYQRAYLKASNTDSADAFGYAVAVAGDTVVAGANREASNATGINGDQSDNSADLAGAVYVFGLGSELSFPSLVKTGYSLPELDLAAGTPGLGALSPSGAALLESRLVGAGTSKGRNQAMLSTLSGTTDIAMQAGTNVGGLLSLPTNATIASLTQPVSNRSAMAALFQATVRGSGIKSASNRLLLLDSGSFVIPLSRTGRSVTELGGAVPSGYREVLQREGAGDQIALSYTLSRGIAGADPTNDTGLILMNHTGAVTHFSARAGAVAFDGGGTFGSVGRAAILGSDRVGFLAKFIPTSGKPVDALFHTGAAAGRNTPLQGDAAGGTSAGEQYGTFTGITRLDSSSLLRSTLSKSPATSNEGVWDQAGSLLLRKGQTVGAGLSVARIVRIWGINGGQMLAQVQLGGTGVNKSNNQALLLRHSAFPHAFQILLRTGDPAPSFGSTAIAVASIQAVDVDPINGHYAILGSLKGAPSSANQALWSGQTTLGNDTTQQSQRLPILRVRKSERYSTLATPGDIIRSIAFRPAVDPSGVGGRGLAQVINATGQAIITLTGDRKVQETVRLEP